MAEPKTVGIIGCGPGGLTSAKASLECGMVPHVFEKSGSIGGVWSSSGLAWDGMRTNLSKFCCSFSDFPMKEDVPLFPSRQEMEIYLNEYAHHFDIWKHIQLKREVTLVEQCEDGRWVLHVANDEGAQQSYTFDFLVVATGFFARLHTPSWPGLHDVFLKNPSNSLVHSGDVSSPRDDRFVGRNVVVVGSAFSAADMSVAISHTASSVTNIVRKPVWVVPRLVDSVPVDLLLFKRGERHTGLPSTSSSASQPVVPVNERPKHLLLSSMADNGCTKDDVCSVLRVPPAAFDRPCFVTISDGYVEAATAASQAVTEAAQAATEAAQAATAQQQAETAQAATATARAAEAESSVETSAHAISASGSSSEGGLSNARPRVHVLKADILEFTATHMVVQPHPPPTHPHPRQHPSDEGGGAGGGGDVTPGSASGSGSGSGSGSDSASRVSIPVDTVLACTGYSAPRLDFLPEGLRSAMGYEPDDRFQPMLLHEAVFAQGYPSIAFVGMYRGPYMAVMELQARWATMIWAGHIPPPPPSEVAAGILAEKRLRAAAPRPQFPRPDYVAVCDSLAVRIGAMTGELANELQGGASLPAHYRLVGAHANMEAAEEGMRRAARGGGGGQ